MKYRADHAFHIGSQHTRSGLPCQDFAMSANGDARVFGVVSDGCSTGGRTEIGAGVVVCSVARQLCNWPDQNIGFDAQDHLICLNMIEAGKALGLTNADLLATNAYVRAIPGENRILVRLSGDGVIASRSGHSISMSRIDWANNMPAYLVYRSDLYEQFVAAHGGDRAAMRMTVTAVQREPCTPDSEIQVEYSLGEGLLGCGKAFDARTVDDVAVFSDGVTQVDGMDWRDVVAELMSFKSTEGEFVKRRMLRYLRDCQNHGKGPIDDISMAAIHVVRD